MKIRVDNKEKIASALEELQNRCAVNCLGVSDISDVATEAQERLNDLLPQKHHPGCIAIYQPAGPWANSYGYSQGATRIELTRTSTGWFLTSAERVLVYPGKKRVRDLLLTSEQKNIYISGIDSHFKY